MKETLNDDAALLRPRMHPAKNAILLAMTDANRMRPGTDAFPIYHAHWLSPGLTLLKGLANSM